MDEAGIQRLQIVIRQPQPRHGLGPHIADEHIAVFQQAQQGFFSTGIFQVQHHRLFALIGLQEDIAHARIPHRADMPHVVALGRLHLDHFSPQRGQNLRGKRPMMTDVMSTALTPASGPEAVVRCSIPTSPYCASILDCSISCPQLLSCCCT